MNKTKLAAVYELKTGKSFNDELARVHRELPDGEVSDKTWTEAIEQVVCEIDLNDELVRKELASSLQRSEKRKYSKSAPGVGRQLAFDEITQEWAETAIIAFEGKSVRRIDATRNHALISWQQKQANAADAADAAVREGQLFEIHSGRGGLRAWIKKHNKD